MKSLDILRAEHKYIQRMIDMVKACMEKPGFSKYVPLGFFNDAIDFFLEYVIKFHYEKEEGILFEEMEKAGVFTEHLPIEAIHSDHQISREFLKKIIHRFSSLNSGNIMENPELIEDMKKFIMLLEHHSKREERVLYPMGDRLISQGVDLKILDYYRTVNGRYKDYHKIYPMLVEKYEKCLKMDNQMIFSDCM